MNVTAAMTRPERVDSATKRFCETLSTGTGLPEIAQMMIGGGEHVDARMCG